jgi:hypothetical protein
MTTTSAGKISLQNFSGAWSRSCLEPEETERMLMEGLIERRRPRLHLPKSALYRLTPKGWAVKKLDEKK